MHKNENCNNNCAICEALKKCGYTKEAEEFCKLVEDVSGRCEPPKEEQPRVAEPFNTIFRTLGWQY